MTDEDDRNSAWRLGLLVCIAQTLVQIGAFFLARTLAATRTTVGAVEQRRRLGDGRLLWRLHAGSSRACHADGSRRSEANLPPGRRADCDWPPPVWMAGEGFWTALACRAVTGIGWAGTYMTGLKLLADRVDAKMMSRATAGHAASNGLPTNPTVGRPTARH